MKHNQNPTKEELEAIAAKNGGSLYLRGTQITSLPDNLTVGDWLDTTPAYSRRFLPRGRINKCLY